MVLEYDESRSWDDNQSERLEKARLNEIRSRNMTATHRGPRGITPTAIAAATKAAEMSMIPWPVKGAMKHSYHWLRNVGIGTSIYICGGVGILGLHMSLLPMIGIGLGSVAVQAVEAVSDRRKKNPKPAKPSLQAPSLDQNLLKAQQSIAALDHKKFETKLPEASSGWTVEDQRSHNDLYWQGTEAFWLNPKVYEGGKMNILAEECPAPEWWTAPKYEDVIPDQVDLVAASLENPNAASNMEEEFQKAFSQMELAQVLEDEDDDSDMFFRVYADSTDQVVKLLQYLGENKSSLAKSIVPSITRDGKLYQAKSSDGLTMNFKSRGEAKGWLDRYEKRLAIEAKKSLGERDIFGVVEERLREAHMKSKKDKWNVGKPFDDWDDDDFDWDSY